MTANRRMRVQDTGKGAIAVVEGDGILLASAADMRDLLLEAYRAKAEAVAIREENIAPAFFDLRTGLAGEILQKAVNYRGRLMIVGDISRYTEKSESLRALVRESNRGKDVRFVRTIKEFLDGIFQEPERRN